MLQAVALSPCGRRRSAQRALLRDIFGVERSPTETSHPRWHGFGLWEDPDGPCVAALEFGSLPLIVSGRERSACAIRRVGVLEQRRGEGLFRQLLTRFLAWRGDRAPSLLYASDPEIYCKFGFRLVPQHAFTGLAPEKVQNGSPACTVDPIAEGRLVDRLFWDREALSSTCACGDVPDLLRDFVAQDAAVVCAFCSDLDALVVFKEEGDHLILIDLVAPLVPSMAAIIGRLGVHPKRVTTLFAPDKLGWSGCPQIEENGLMARGASEWFADLGPFMLPTSTEF